MYVPFKDRPSAARAFLARANAALDSPGFKAGALLALLVAYFIAYLNSPYLPFGSIAKGWWQHWDQAKFLASTTSLAKGSLDPATYWYPLGYPALGALFYGILPLHPFLPVNAACLMASAVFFWKMARSFLSPLHAVLLFILALCLLSQELDLSVVKPWNTIPTMALAYGLIWAHFKPEITRRGAIAQFALVGVTYLIRPSDAAFLMVLPALAAFRGRGWKEAALTALAGGAVFAVFPLAVVAVNLAVFGNARTPYELNSGDIGFFAQPALMKLYSIFVDGLPVFGRPESALLPRMPWLLLAPVGLFAAARKNGPGTLAMASSALVCLAVYVAYNDFTILNLYDFETIHYICWTLPLLLLFAYLAVAGLSAFRPAVLAGLVLSVAVLVLARVERVVLASGSTDGQGKVVLENADVPPADAAVLDAAAPMPRSWPEVLDNGTPLKPFRDYLSWNGPMGANVAFTRRVGPNGLEFVPESLHGRSVVFERYRWGVRGAEDMPEVALRLLGGSGPFAPTVRALASPPEAGETRVRVTVEGPACLLRGASAWFVGVSGVGAFSSSLPPAPLAEPLRVSDAPGGIALTFVAPRPLPEKPVVVVSPVNAAGVPLLVWKAEVRQGHEEGQ